MARRTHDRTPHEGELPGRALHNAVLGLTLVLVVAALICSIGFVMYTAWLHDLKRGAFALVFAVMSAKIALNWFIWRDEDVTLSPDSQPHPPPGAPF